MSLFRITHIDSRRKCRRLRVLAVNCRQALRQVEQEFGEAWFACAVKLEAQP